MALDTSAIASPCVMKNSSEMADRPTAKASAATQACARITRRYHNTPRLPRPKPTTSHSSPIFKGVRPWPGSNSTGKRSGQTRPMLPATPTTASIRAKASRFCTSVASGPWGSSTYTSKAPAASRRAASQNASALCGLLMLSTSGMPGKLSACKKSSSPTPKKHTPSNTTARLRADKTAW